MTIRVRTNGDAPIITSCSAPRPRTPWTTKRLMPTGGVIMAVSMRRMMMMPNHTGSNPSETMTGVMMGTVATIIDSVSMNMPSTT